MRCEYHRLQYFTETSKFVTRSSQMLHADEVGQDGRGGSRRRGWGRRCVGVLAALGSNGAGDS